MRVISPSSALADAAAIIVSGFAGRSLVRTALEPPLRVATVAFFVILTGGAFFFRAAEGSTRANCDHVHHLAHSLAPAVNTVIA